MADSRTQAIKDRMRQRCGEVEKKTGNKIGFFKFRECKSVQDRGNLVRWIFPPQFDETKDDPWVATQKYNLPMEGYQYGLDVYVPSLYGEPDPLRDERERLLSMKQDDAAKELNPRDEYVGMLVDVETPEGLAKGVQIVRLSNTAAKEFLDAFADEQYGCVWDPKTGFNLRVRRTGTGWDTAYSVKPERHESELPNAEELMEQARAIDLTKFIKIETEDTLVEILNGEYDPEEALERRKERDKATGHPVHRFYFGDEQGAADEGGPNPTSAGAAAQTATKDSTKSGRAPAAGGTTGKTARANSAATPKTTATRSTRQGASATSAVTSTAATLASGTTGTSTRMTSPSDLQKHVGTTVHFVSQGKVRQAECKALDTYEGKTVLVINLDGEDVALDPAQVVEPPAQDPTQTEHEAAGADLSEGQQAEYSSRLRKLADK